MTDSLVARTNLIALYAHTPFTQSTGASLSAVTAVHHPHSDGHFVAPCRIGCASHFWESSLSV